MAADVTFKPGQIAEEVLYTAQAITTGSGNKVSKTLAIPAGIDALEVAVKYTTANRSVKVRIFNSLDGTNFETTATAEYEIVDAVQLVKFDRWDCSRVVKVEIEAYTQNCTVDVKARVAL